jgi:hypothetical protein
VSIAPVQATGSQSSGQVGALSVAYDANVAQGSLLVAAAVSSVAEFPESGCVDNLGNEWRRLGQFHRSDADLPHESIAFYAALSQAAAGCVVTVTPDAADWFTVCVTEWSGDWDPDDLADVGLTYNTGNGFSPATGNLPTRYADLILAALTHNSVTSDALTPNAGWTQLYEAENVANMPMSVVYKIAAAGDYNPGWASVGTGAPTSCAGVALKERG